jgi:uncharacterized protein
MSGHLADNVLLFIRMLREAGLPTGPDQALLALQALQLCGIERRSDVHDVLRACLVSRHGQLPLFERAFELFWREPGRPVLAGQAPPEEPSPDGTKTARHKPLQCSAPCLEAGHKAQTLGLPPHHRGDGQPRATPLAAGVGGTAGSLEHLYKADFGAMTPDEWQQAKAALHAMHALPPLRPARRWKHSTGNGRIDWRGSLQAMARRGSLAWPARWHQRRRKPGPLVLLADISGSMNRYSRMLLHFAHALIQGQGPVSCFVFGTRLTPVTQPLRHRDPDVAVARTLALVEDWSGGTRLTACLREFNRHWTRRVLDRPGTVLLVTDGLEHGDTAALGAEAERLRRSCRQLVWLNPLLRFQGFEPRAAGIRALLPHVDRFIPVHNLASLRALAHLLSASPPLPRPSLDRAGRPPPTRDVLVPLSPNPLPWN